VTDEAPVEDEPAPAPRRRSRVLPVLTALVAVVAVVLGVTAVSLRGQLERERGDRRDVESVAGAFSEAILSYDFEHLDATRDRVLDLATGDFAADFEKSFKGLSALVEAVNGRATATVQDVFVGDISDGEATVITVVDLTATGTSGDRTVPDSYIRLSLVRVEGEWKVDGLTSLNFAQDEAPAAP
jgi:Mce-associated membrane protein